MFTIESELEKDKRTMGKRWAEMGQLFGDWWRAREDRALSSLLTAQTERKLRQSVEGQTATHPPHSLHPPFLPTEKSFPRASGEAVSSQTHSTSGRSRTSSPSHDTLVQVHFSALRVISFACWVDVIVSKCYSVNGELRLDSLPISSV